MEWLTLPQIARELGIADSTARRWAKAFGDLLPSRGSGAARRFEPQAREVLAQAQALFDRGMTTEEVGKSLRQRYPATVDVVPVSDERADERNVVAQQIAQELKGIRQSLQEQAATMEEQDRHHQEAMERMIEQQDQQMQELRAWLEARLPPVEAKRLGLVARVRAMLRRDRGHG